MAFSVTPSLGFTDTLSAPLGYWDVAGGKPSPLPGAKIIGSDGHEYVFATATGVVPAAATTVLLTEPGMTFAAGGTIWQTTVANIAIGDRTWLRKILI